MRKALLINSIRDLLIPDNTPRVLVFRSIDDDNTAYAHKEEVYTKEQCSKMPARMRIFVVRECRRREQA